MSQVSYCTKCGKKLEQDTVFCPQCGTKVIHTEDSTQNTIVTPKQEKSSNAQNMFANVVGTHSFSLFNISEKFESCYFVEKYINKEFAKELGEFKKEASKMINNYMGRYKDTPERFSELTRSIYMSWSYTLQKYAELFKFSDDAYDALIDSYEGLYESVAEIVEEMITYIYMVDQATDARQLEREIKKACAGRWQISGVGIVGGIVGSATGALLNAGTDAIRNSVNNSRQRKDMKANVKMKNELFEEISNTLKKFVAKTEQDSINIFLKFIGIEYPMAIKRQSSANKKSLKEIEEIKKGCSYSEYSQTLIDLLKANPWCLEYYGVILSHIFKNENDKERRKDIETLLNIARLFNQDLSKELATRIKEYIHELDKNDKKTCKEALFLTSVCKVDDKNFLKDCIRCYTDSISNDLSTNELITVYSDLLSLIDQQKDMDEYDFLSKMVTENFFDTCNRKVLLKYSSTEINDLLSIYRTVQNNWSYPIEGEIKKLANKVLKHHNITLRANDLTELRREIASLEKLEQCSDLDFSKELKAQKSILATLEKEEEIASRTVEIISSYDVFNGTHSLQSKVCQTSDKAESTKNIMSQVLSLCGELLALIDDENEWHKKISSIQKLYELVPDVDENVTTSLITSINEQRTLHFQELNAIAEKNELTEANKIYQKNRGNIAAAYKEMLKADFQYYSAAHYSLSAKERIQKSLSDLEHRRSTAFSDAFDISGLFAALVLSAICLFVFTKVSGVWTYVFIGLAVFYPLKYLVGVIKNLIRGFDTKKYVRQEKKKITTFFRVIYGNIVPLDESLKITQDKYEKIDRLHTPSE